jgi:hypothetical protein
LIDIAFTFSPLLLFYFAIIDYFRPLSILIDDDFQLSLSLPATFSFYAFIDDIADDIDI